MTLHRGGHTDETFRAEEKADRRRVGAWSSIGRNGQSLVSEQSNPQLLRERKGEGRQTDGEVGAVGAVSVAEALKLARRFDVRLDVNGDNVTFEAPDAPISYAILDALRIRKSEVVAQLRDERRLVVRWIVDNFRSSPLGVCTHCGGGSRLDDPFVVVFAGDDRADVHGRCYPMWVEEQEERARVALALLPQSKENEAQ